MCPKPNFVKKPMSKIMDESIDKLPNTKIRYCGDCGEPIHLCECDMEFDPDWHPVDRDGLKD